MKNIITLSLLTVIPFVQGNCCQAKSFDAMTDEQRTATGIEKLSAEERAELASWISQKKKSGKKAHFRKAHSHKARFQDRTDHNKKRARAFVIKEVDAVNGVIVDENGTSYQVGTRGLDIVKTWNSGDRVIGFSAKKNTWCSLKNLTSQEKIGAKKIAPLTSA
jgi:hypothetical protein